MNDPSKAYLDLPVIRHLLVDLILKAKLTENPEQLDPLVNETLPKIQAALRYSDQLITEKDVAALYPRLFDVVKLRNLRSRGGSPKFIKFGSSRNARVFYRISAIEEWICEHEETSEPFVTSFKKCA